MRVADGQSLLTELRRAGFEPTVAGWVRHESGRWTLYLGTASRDRDERLAIRQKLIDCFGRLKEPWFSLIDISLTDADGPLARELVRLRGRLASREPGHFQIEELAGQPVQEVYVYPKPGDLTPREVSRAVFWAITNHVFGLKTAHVTFRDGRTLRAVPIGLGGVGHQLDVQLRNTDTGQTEVVAADSISDIRFQ